VNGIGPAGLPLDEYLDHRGRVGPDQLLWENNGWSVRGTAGGRQFLLWTSPYFLKGYPGGAFRLGTASLNQTLLVFAHDVGAPLHAPNRFRSVGWEPEEFGGWRDWLVERGPTAVTWTDQRRTFVTHREGWRVSGAHAGVELDLELQPMRDAMWLTPPEETLGARQDRWWIANARATGTMVVDRMVLPVEGHALHERHIHLGTDYNPVRLLRGGGVTWQSGAAPGLSYSLLARPSLGRYWALVEIDGEVLEVRDRDRIRVDATDHWVDPDTGLHLPRAWEVCIDTPRGRLEVRTTAHARAYYLWNFLRDGLTVLYWWLCTSTAAVTTKAGVRVVDHIRSEVHLNRTLYEAPAARTEP
jgi:hypothetical protein